MIRAKFSVRAVTIIAACFLIALFSTLAGTTRAQTDTTSNSAVVLVLDVSDSMLGSPIAEARAAMQLFVDEINGTIPIAIVTFGSEAVLVQDFTTDTVILNEVIEEIVAGGSTALYDGALLGVETVIEADAENAHVILLSDGAEFGGQSAATRDAATLLAEASGVNLHTVGLGFGTDRTLLTEMSESTDAAYYEVLEGEQIIEVYVELSEIIITNDTTGINPLLDETTQDELLNTNNTDDVEGIDALGAIDLAAEDETTAEDSEEAEGQVGALAASDARATAAASGDADDEEAQSDEERVLIAPIDQFIPISIEVLDDADASTVLFALNEFDLVEFDAEPYTYNLEASLLQPGTYELQVTVDSEAGPSVSDIATFEVITYEEYVESLTTAAQTTEEGETADADLITESALDGVPESGLVVLFDGEVRDLNFTFSREAGLDLIIPTPNAVEIAETQNLTDILFAPFEQIPEPVRNALTRQYPVVMSVLLVVTTVLLLPQGLFTIYWMTYTWVNPERLEISEAPKQAMEPHYSFTALVPARREEAVIYDTIMTVNSIDYPEHLKETLILVRDEDDDETIAEARRAIEDVKRTYREKNQRYPDNIHLITFKDGPKNKPNGLNRGYRETTKNVICIFDAEDSPHAQIYNTVNTIMLRDKADVVQSGVQLMNFKSTWFSAFNVLEYFFWFKSGLHAYTNELNVTPLGGNTVFFKKKWMDKLAALDTEKGYRVWDEGKLTEDADIGIRLTYMGAKIKIVYEAEQATREETPENIEQFIKQRTRWCQGFYEIFIDYEWLKLPQLKQRIASFYILLNSVLQAAVLVFLPLGIYIALTQSVPVIVALFSWLPVYLLLTQMVITLIGMREFAEAYGEKLPFGFRLRMAILYYPYQLLLAVSAIRALWRFFTNQSAWEKTAHSNQHRQDGVSHAA